MHIHDLETPAILVDLEILEQNIAHYQQACDKHGKELWPMIKTHKSTHIARMQERAGAKGFLCGTLDECEAMARAGFKRLMYAYPVATAASAARAARLAGMCDFTIRIDCLESARSLSQSAVLAGVEIRYTIIIDSGLHRFGIPAENAAELAKQTDALPGLKFMGVSTHPGHVYGASSHAELADYVKNEQDALLIAITCLKKSGFNCEMVTSGSTPTFMGGVSASHINIFHPGNYVFHDVIQLALGVAGVADCALSVLASVVSSPAKERMLVDAGSKCLGLDQGAHSANNLKGFGRVKEFPEITVISVSEEVGKLHVPSSTPLRAGDMISIIPNHSCSSANLTSWLIGHRKGVIESVIPVDMRSNSSVYH